MRCGRRISVMAVSVVVVLVAAAGCAQGDDAGSPRIALDTPGSAGSSVPAGGGSAGQGVAAQIAPSATPDYLRQAGANTHQAGTGRVRMVAAVTGGAGHEGRTTELSVLDGVWDNGAGRSRLRVDPTGAQRAGGTGIAVLFGGPVEIIQIGEVRYLQLGAATGSRWIRSEGDPGAVRMVFDRLALPDVSAFLEALACAGPVTEAGREELDGVPTNRYRVVAPADTLKTCIDRNPKAKELLDHLGESRSAEVDLWIDEGGLVRRLVVTADERAIGAGLADRFHGGTSTMTMSLSGFGEPVTVEAPPADQVDEGMTGLEALLGGSGGAGDGAGSADLDDLTDLLDGLG